MQNEPITPIKTHAGEYPQSPHPAIGTLTEKDKQMFNPVSAPPAQSCPLMTACIPNPLSASKPAFISANCQRERCAFWNFDFQACAHLATSLATKEQTKMILQAELTLSAALRQSADTIAKSNYSGRE